MFDSTIVHGLQPIVPTTQQLKRIDENTALKHGMARADIKYRSDPLVPLPSEDLARYLSQVRMLEI